MKKTIMNVRKVRKVKKGARLKRKSKKENTFKKRLAVKMEITDGFWMKELKTYADCGAGEKH